MLTLFRRLLQIFLESQRHGKSTEQQEKGEEGETDE